MAKTDAIQNLFPDDYRPSATSIRYFRDMSLEEIEDGIRQAQRAINSSILSMGIAIVAIEADAKYAEAGYRSFQDYLKDTDERLQMPKQTISDYRRIASIFVEHKASLDRIQWTESDGLHKLRHLPKALEHHRPSSVFKRIKDMSYRQFREYAMPESITTTTQSEWPVELTDDEVNIIAEKVKKIRAAGNFEYIVEIQDRGEERVVQRALRNHRQRN